MNIKNCPYCGSRTLYILKNNYRKCKDCNKKISLNKLENDLKIIEGFCENIPALNLSKDLNMNYRTVSNRYDIFRKIIANYLEKLYYSSIQDNTSYEEFYYFNEKQLQKKNKSLYEAINIIGFYSNQRVFTLLMPSLPRPPLQDRDEDFERYLKWHKVQSQNSYKTPLKDFWSYLRENLKKYKGVTNDNFFFYLKECEFKYNFSKPICKALLKDIYFRS
ncbi:hypothetical protein CP960_11870 [Malaciobacter halophilus]|uniref:Transposase n=1 Tax=Malaciobacter halophilus TaxID=197482 RepID=A0A2N1J065_9BACT|nr:hypothetical protein [Malaciobacter halophilus]AXH09492.1 hypothetical protein AHALO_1114 [Malaciobacter halophilus]PKI79947.1 hypothetical protein CP960_11870 [Malaciobacter halophilus]